MTESAERIAALRAKKTQASKRSTPGLATRILVAGTALGGGLMMIGAMGTAAQQAASAPAAPVAAQTIRQIVVLPQQPAQAEPIVVVIPAEGAPTPAIQPPPTQPPPTARPSLQPPAPASPPVVKAAPAPVTESGGS